MKHQDAYARRVCWRRPRAKCQARIANHYGVELAYVAAPSIHPDVIGPEDERLFREQAALRRQIELAEGDLWLFD